MSNFVLKLTNILDHNWFCDKLKYFSEEPFYNASQSKIFDIIPMKEMYMDGEQLFEDSYDIVIDKTLSDYCWDDFFYGSLSKSMAEYETPPPLTLPINSKSVAYAIIEYIDETTKKFRTPKAIYSFVSITISEIKNALEDLYSQAHNQNYKEALDFFYEKTLEILNERYSIINDEVKILNEGKDKLEFNLSQEKMVALLYLLNRAGVFNTYNYNDREFLKFCCQYFYFFHNGTYKQPKSYTILTNKYGEFINGENNGNLNDVIAQIQEAIKEIKQ